LFLLLCWLATEHLGVLLEGAKSWRLGGYRTKAVAPNAIAAMPSTAAQARIEDKTGEKLG
jgi:hypothetical protein